MQNKDIANATIADFTAEIKQTLRPNLFTALTIHNEQFGEMIINAYDILEIARQVTNEFLSEYDSEKIGDSILGEGSLEKPYILDTTKKWLWAAANFEIEETNTIKTPKSLSNITPERKPPFYQIGGQPIDVTRDERKASSQHLANDDAFSQNMENSMLQTTSNLFNISNTNETIDILSHFTTEASAENIPESNSVQRLLPFILFLIQEAEAKHIPDDTTWRATPYSRLGKEHSTAQNYAAENIHKITSITPEKIDTMITEMQTSNFSESKESFSDLPKIVTNLSNTLVKGMVGEDKFQEISPKFTEFTQAIGEILDPNKMNAENPFEFFSAFFRNTQEYIKNSKDPHLQSMNTDFLGEDVETIFKNVGNALMGNSVEQKQEAISIINELSHISVIAEIRSILEGTAYRVNRYLPITVGALFFSETSRYLLTFIASCALLDLIQLTVTCPDANEIYTLTNALVNPNQRNEFVDAYGKLYSNNETEKKATLKKKYLDALYPANEEIKKQIINRDKKQIKKSQEIDLEIKKVIPGKTTQHIGGYHPMVQGFSYDDTKNIPPNEEISESKELVVVQQKIANILLQWLKLYLPSDEFTVTLQKIFLSDLPFPQPEMPDKKKIFLEKYIKPLFRARIESFKLLSIPSKKNYGHKKQEISFSEEAELDRVALESQRSITDILIDGGTKKCIVVKAKPDGNCGFTATRHALILQGRDDLAEEMDRENFIDLIEFIINNNQKFQIFNHYIAEIFKIDNAISLLEWKEKFKNSGYWVQTPHFKLLSSYYNIYFNFYCLSDTQENAFKPKLGDEYIDECTDKNSTVITLACVSTQLLNKPDANLNHFDSIVIEPTDQQLKEIREVIYNIVENEPLDKNNFSTPVLVSDMEILESPKNVVASMVNTTTLSSNPQLLITTLKERASVNIDPHSVLFPVLEQTFANDQIKKTTNIQTHSDNNQKSEQNQDIEFKL